MQLATRTIFAGRPAVPLGASDPAAAVRVFLACQEDRIDFAEAKLAFDALIDPSLDIGAARAELDCLTAAAHRLAGPDADPAARLAALRRLTYESGPWNGHCPFAYDHDDPLGRCLGNKLLPAYLDTRRGNCVSMPILFVILGERLGLDLALATAPLHLFVRWHHGSSRVLNLETTSGAHPARLAWYRRNMPMSDRALASGLYMRSLGRREAAALMASTVVEHLMDERRFAEAAAVGETIVAHAPRDAYAMVKLATACARLIEREFGEYPSPFLIPPLLRPRYLRLLDRNRALFEAAEALGWELAE